MSDTPKTDLVKQGLTAARVGDLADARRLLAKATRQEPDNVEAWLGLAGVVESLEAKRDCFTQVLALDPANSEAQEALARVERKLSAGQAAPEEDEADLLFCYRHPTVETTLRCNRCGNPICPRCAVRTPVGFRCPDCIRQQESKYYTGSNMDYLIAVVIALPLSLIAAALFTFLLGGFGIWVILIGIFVAPAVAGFIAEAVRWGVGRRRSRYLGQVVAGCIILASAPFLIMMFISVGTWGLIAPGIFAFLGVTTVLARLR